MKGPEIFLERLKIELNKFGLKQYKIFIPLKNSVTDIKNFNGLKIGRLDGAIYFKYNSNSFFNLIKQRKNRKISIIKFIPNFIFSLLQSKINSYLNRYNSLILRESDVIVFQSKISKKMHEYFWGKTKKKTCIIFNGIRKTEFINRQVDSKINIVITARFRLNKRLKDAIRIVNQLNSSDKKFKLHVIGSIDYLTKKSIAELDTKYVKFYGDIDFSHIKKLYKSMHIGISTSMFDPCPNSVIEMMSLSIPVITTSASGASELVGIKNLIVDEKLNFKLYDLHDINGIPQVNYDDWCDKIESLLYDYNFLSKKVYQRFINNFEITIIANQYKNLIESYGK